MLAEETEETTQEIPSRIKRRKLRRWSVLTVYTADSGRGHRNHAEIKTIQEKQSGQE